MSKSNKIKTQKVVVTGSTGMIGSHLVVELVRQGYTDITLPMRNAKRAENIYKRFAKLGVKPDTATLNIIETELTDIPAMTKAMEGADVVFHCAAIIMTGKDIDEQGLISNNVALAKSVADAAIAAGVRRVVHTSSIAVLCPEGNGQLITEDNQPAINENSNPYPKSKYYADLEMNRVRSAGIELVTLYPAVVIGEGDWSLNGSSAMIPFICIGLPFYTDGVMAYVDVHDVARAYVTLAEYDDAANQGFIISGANLSYRELLILGAEASGRRKPHIKIGEGAINFAYGVVKGVTALHLMKDRSIKKSNLASVLYGNSYSGAKIEKFCNFEYTPMEQTIGRVVNNYLTDKKKRNK